MAFFKKKNPEMDAEMNSPEPERSEIENEVYEEAPRSVQSNMHLEQVDIPVNEDLTDYETRTNIGDGVDFDFTDLSEIDSDPQRSKLQSINPLKGLSHQVKLDLDSVARKGFVTPNQERSPLTNSFRMIKRPILNIARGKGQVVPEKANMVAITSSVNGEGKSYTAINLAISIAMERDKHVLLIDADVNKPSHHKIFNLESQRGLTDLLLGNVKDMSDILYKTSIPSLSLMFAGDVVPLATELLASQAMEDFIAEVSGRYPDRVIIFDTPPLLLTTEASVLASYMGQVILVIEAEKTQRKLVDQSLSLLHNDVVMLLLNKTRVKGDEGGYGYYGYGHNP